MFEPEFHGDDVFCGFRYSLKSVTWYSHVPTWIVSSSNWRPRMMWNRRTTVFPADSSDVHDCAPEFAPCCQSI